MSMLRSPAVVEAIYQQAEIVYTIDNVSRFTSQFLTTGSSQQVTVTLMLQSGRSKALAEAMTLVLSREVSLAQPIPMVAACFTECLTAGSCLPAGERHLHDKCGRVRWLLLALMLVHIRRYRNNDAPGIDARPLLNRTHPASVSIPLLLRALLCYRAAGYIVMYQLNVPTDRLNRSNLSPLNGNISISLIFALHLCRRLISADQVDVLFTPIEFYTGTRLSGSLTA